MPPTITPKPLHNLTQYTSPTHNLHNHPDCLMKALTNQKSPHQTKLPSKPTPTNPKQILTPSQQPYTSQPSHTKTTNPTTKSIIFIILPILFKISQETLA